MRYELIDPSMNRNKFWEVEVSGTEVTTRWGRIGAAPAQKTKDFGSAAKAQAEAERLVKKKEEKGYSLVDGETETGKKTSGKKASGKKASGKKTDREWQLWVFIKSGVSPSDAKKVTKALNRFKGLEWMGDGADQFEFDVSFFGKKAVVEKASSAVDALKIEGVRAEVKETDRDEPKTPKSKKASGKSKCDHCGKPSKSPSECKEPWEHHHFKGGCSCAYCRAHPPAKKSSAKKAAKLPSSDVNWLAAHGWSSKQIAAMTPTEARRLVKAGEPKSPGTQSRQAALGSQQKKLLEEGIGFTIKKGSFQSICNAVAKLGGSSAVLHTNRMALNSLVKGFFTDGKRDVVVLPRDKRVVSAVYMALRRAPVAKSLYGAIYDFMQRAH